MIYSYSCPDCDKITTASRPMANRRDPLKCECGGDTRLKITGGTGFTPVYGDMNAYRCPVSDEWVTSRRQRKEIMAKHDIVEHSSADTKGVHNPSFR